MTRVKHHWGKLGDIPIYSSALPAILSGVDLAVECFSSDSQFRHVDAYHAELRASVLRPKGHIYQVSHHLAHLYSAYFPSGFAGCAGMVIDFQGSYANRFSESYELPEGSDGGYLEVASFYDCNDGQIRCIGKQLWNGDRARLVGLGAFYQSLTQLIWPKGEGQEGKVMGLAALGDPSAMALPSLIVRGCEVFIPNEWLELFKTQRRFLFNADDAYAFRQAADLAAIGQKVFEEALLSLANWLHQQTGRTSLCYSGGCALNCSANGKLLRNTGFQKVFIPPAAGDAGTAVGCAIYGQVEILRQVCSFRWTTDFLGPEPLIPSSLNEYDLADLSVACPDDLPSAVAALLEKQQAVALFEGRSELGPRALGHRSLLADPRHLEMRTWLNRAKGRELFRPFAPAVLEEHAMEYFDLHEAMPFMQYAVATKEPARSTIPAAIHVDGTARVQTVPLGYGHTYRSIIERFFERTDVPILLNTSFNDNEEPIVETVSDAIRTFCRMPVHALVVPPFLLRKKELLPTWDEVVRKSN